MSSRNQEGVTLVGVSGRWAWGNGGSEMAIISLFVLEQKDGRSDALMHAERRPSGGMGRKYYYN